MTQKPGGYSPPEWVKEIVERRQIDINSLPENTQLDQRAIKEIKDYLRSKGVAEKLLSPNAHGKWHGHVSILEANEKWYLGFNKDLDSSVVQNVLNTKLANLPKLPE